MSGAGGPIPCAAPVPGLFVPAAVTVGKHEIDGWKVAVLPLGNGANGNGREAGTPIVLSPEQAIKLGEELIEMAAICDGRWGE